MLIIWEFTARSDKVEAFERAYGPAGDWARLFERGDGYLGSELLRESAGKRLYLTIDRWSSPAAFEAFRSAFQSEYEALDAKLETLTERETRIGSFDPIA